MIATIVPNSAAPTDQRFARDPSNGKRRQGSSRFLTDTLTGISPETFPPKFGVPYSALSPVISIAWP
jgi:hypothetical protein